MRPQQTKQLKNFDHDRTRTCNPQIRSLVPYPLGHMVRGDSKHNQTKERADFQTTQIQKHSDPAQDRTGDLLRVKQM